MKKIKISKILKIGFLAAVLGGLAFLPTADPFKAEAAAGIILIDVPFTSQAPLGQWSDQRQQDGCEEATAAMAMAWVKGQSNFTKTQWRNRIVGLADWEFAHFGEYRDTSLADTVSWIFKSYYNYDKVSVKSVSSAADILSELEAGHVVITPMNGRLLNNPYYTPPGPTTHMILVKGYDYNTHEFIVNDVGTKRGESYRYPEKVFFNAIRAYSTGNYVPPVIAVKKGMIVVSK